MSLTENTFNAAEARKIAGPTIEERVEEALGVIEATAKEKRRQCHLHSDFWVNEGYSRTDDWNAAAKLLRDRGFTVEFFYEERQFVNMFTLVKW